MHYFIINTRFIYLPDLTKTFEKEEHSLHNVQQEKVSEELEQLKRELELASENSDHIKLQIGELQKKITERKEIMEDFIGKQQALDHKINKTIPSSQ
ncbi:hypothetical protein LSH36_34g01036 [Paralvinella palmiformis]|uniref:Uncharacterized protein n=1 Tax=Paralvinella palmiformis TaxID=53620 RepID=A0AAD9K9B8_9ANNE|nr:hypothetical protein LSH36_34g01036 [Paralvinella palmiformis]